MRFDEWEASNGVGKVYVVHTRIKEIQTSDTSSRTCQQQSNLTNEILEFCMTVAVSGI